MALLYKPYGTIPLDHLIQEDAPGLLALRHALRYPRYGLWVNNLRAPTSILFHRRTRTPLELEVFAAGDPTPVLRWLRRNCPANSVRLLAPDDWDPLIARAVGKDRQLERGKVETWHDPQPLRSDGKRSAGPRVRPLTRADAPLFTAMAPEWALRGWRSFEFLLTFGAAFGVPHGDGLAAIAWIYDSTDTFDAIGVFTPDRYRRLGLARAAAATLLRHIQQDRRRQPLWSTLASNTESIALARSLGFTQVVHETVFSWSSAFD